jgi:HD-GYP domain-containing protein (c-di-GMP phosphodiesterase class II)
MAAHLEKLRDCHGELESMGSLPLLPLEDFAEYSSVCSVVVDIAESLASAPATDPHPEATVDLLLAIAETLKRAGDDLTATDLLHRAARCAEAHRLTRLASQSHNLAGINLYCLGEYEAAMVEFDLALDALPDDAYGAVRSLLVRMNRGNVVHDLKRFDEAEATFRDILERTSRIAPGDFEDHAPIAADRFVGMLSHNACTNRLEWARADGIADSRLGKHLAVAEGFLNQAFARPLADTERIQVLINQATIWMLAGKPEAAERRLLELAHHCAGERDLMVLLPEIYRTAAEACAAAGETRRAIVNCYRSLESSHAVADRLQERRVVETFVAVLALSSSLLIEPGASASRKAERIESEAAPLVARLVDFLERKDWYTGHSHSKAVQTVSLRMARALAAPATSGGEAARDEIEWHTLGLAAALHDIGKLLVPWSVLNKLIPLSDRDRAILGRHPEAGRDILVGVGLAEIGDIVVEHHESPDGAGYPAGRRDSSLMGAIIAVADAFEAMTTVNRRYRTPKSKDEAVREVLALAGRQFDARVAGALATVLSRTQS